MAGEGVAEGRGGGVADLGPGRLGVEGPEEERELEGVAGAAGADGGGLLPGEEVGAGGAGGVGAGVEEALAGLAVDRLGEAGLELLGRGRLAAEVGAQGGGERLRPAAARRGPVRQEQRQFALEELRRRVRTTGIDEAGALVHVRADDQIHRRGGPGGDRVDRRRGQHAAVEARPEGGRRVRVAGRAPLDQALLGGDHLLPRQSEQPRRIVRQAQEREQLGGDALAEVPRAHPLRVAALQHRPLEEPGGSGRGEQRRDEHRARGLTGEGHPRRVTAERGDARAHPAERADHVEQREVRGVGVLGAEQVLEGQEAEGAEAVIHRDDDHPARGGEARAVGQRLRVRSDDVQAAVHPDEDGQVAGGGVRRPDVQVQGVPLGDGRVGERLRGDRPARGRGAHARPALRRDAGPEALRDLQEGHAEEGVHRAVRRLEHPAAHGSARSDDDRHAGWCSTGPWPGESVLCSTREEAPIAAASRGLADSSTLIGCARRAKRRPSSRERSARV